MTRKAGTVRAGLGRATVPIQTAYGNRTKRYWLLKWWGLSAKA
jgi:hypothetical protein